MKRYHGYLAVQGGEKIALPRELRRRYQLDAPGAQVEVTEREDGIIELRPTLPVPVDEMWFWSADYQRTVRDGEADLSNGRFRDFDSSESFLADLTALHADPTLVPPPPGAGSVPVIPAGRVMPGGAPMPAPAITGPVEPTPNGSASVTGPAT
jgi:bifunctional DNA-binding transcriptional regulator/antitoxin component of YhaV-PrlF toxin-antitoxin module